MPENIMRMGTVSKGVKNSGRFFKTGQWRRKTTHHEGGIRNEGKPHTTTQAAEK